MVFGSNVKRARRHIKESQDLCQMEEMVEGRHQTHKMDGREREAVTRELG
jgi:hypothetical protein